MTHRTKGILNVTLKNIPGLLSQAWLNYNSMLAEPTVYVAPNPSLPVYLADIEGLETSQKATIGVKSPALSKARDAKAEVVIRDLEHQLSYVQDLGDKSPASAAKLLAGAGFRQRRTGVRSKELLELELGPPGTLLAHCNLSALVGRGVKRKVTINWCYSIDGGKVYLNAPSTPLAHTTIANLPRMTQVFVKVSATVSEATGPWSSPKDILIP